MTFLNIEEAAPPPARQGQIDTGHLGPGNRGASAADQGYASGQEVLDLGLSDAVSGQLLDSILPELGYLGIDIEVRALDGQLRAQSEQRPSTPRQEELPPGHGLHLRKAL